MRLSGNMYNARLWVACGNKKLFDFKIFITNICFPLYFL